MCHECPHCGELDCQCDEDAPEPRCRCSLCLCDEVVDGGECRVCNNCLAGVHQG
mgnify:CR=1 FL=1